MRGGVDSTRETADDGQPRISEFVGEFFCRLVSIMRRPARADDADRVMIALLNFAPNIENDRRRVNFAQRLRIFRRSLRDHLCAERFDPLELCWKIDDGFPV